MRGRVRETGAACCDWSPWVLGATVGGLGLQMAFASFGRCRGPRVNLQHSRATSRGRDLEFQQWYWTRERKTDIDCYLGSSSFRVRL